MKIATIFCLGVAAKSCPELVSAQPLQVSTKNGGSVITEFGYGIKLNKNSSLRRTIVVINDPTSPLQLDGAGIMTGYGDRNYTYKRPRLTIR